MLRKLMPHVTIILSMMYFVFFFIDRVNSAMNFIDNDLTKGLLFALCVLAILNALFMIRDDRARERRHQQILRQRRAQRTKEDY